MEAEMARCTGSPLLRSRPPFLLPGVLLGRPATCLVQGGLIHLLPQRRLLLSMQPSHVAHLGGSNSVYGEGLAFLAAFERPWVGDHGCLFQTGLYLHSTSHLLTQRDSQDIKLAENDISAKNQTRLSEIQVFTVRSPTTSSLPPHAWMRALC